MTARYVVIYVDL